MQSFKEISRLLAERVEDIARYLLPKGKRIGNEWCIGSINGEEGSSLKIHLEGVKAGIWCDFATGDKGDLLDLWSFIRNSSLHETLAQAKTYLGIETPRFTLAATKNYAKPKLDRYRSLIPISDVFNYLTQERGLTLKTLNAFKIGESEQQVVFPYWRDEELLQIKYLNLKRPNGKKQIHVEANCAPCLFGWQALPSHTRFIVLTEGEIDAMTVHQYGFPALSLPFGGGKGAKQQWIEYEFDRLAVFDEIYLCLDNDAEGQAAVSEIIERLGRHRCRLVHLPYKDANACLQAKTSKEEIQRYFEQAQLLDPKELKPALSFVEEVIREFYPSSSEELGLTLPWEKTKGKILLRPEELSLWTGINGHGKSQLLGHLILHALEQGYRVCVASLELKPQRLLGRLARQAGALALPSENYIKAIHEWYSDRLWLFDVTGTTKADKILDVFLYARQRYGIDIFVIDSLMKCGFAEDDYNQQKLFIDRLCEFKNEHHCHIHLVAHPRKGVDEQTPPNKLDIKGSGAITDLADNCFTVWRNKSKEQTLQIAQTQNKVLAEETLNKPDCLLICDKQRNGEWEGKIALWFDPKSLQYLNYSHQKPTRFVPYSELNSERM